MSLYDLLGYDIKTNKDPFNLICKTMIVKTIHDYNMLTDLDYGFKNKKMNNNVCFNCKSTNIVYDDQKTCINCGSVLDNVYVTSYNQRDNYTKYVNNMYKRKTYVKIIINQKLNDLSGNIKANYK